MCSSGFSRPGCLESLVWRHDGRGIQVPMKSIHNQKTAALIVGAGAVANAWAPVLRALQPFYGFSLTDDGATSVLARLVHLLRFWAQNPTSHAASELAKLKRFLSLIRSSIAVELEQAEASGELSVREQFNDIVQSTIAGYGDRFILVNTNWDLVVDTAFPVAIAKGWNLKDFNAVHIHGSRKNSDLMYLPSEVTWEPYRTAAEQQTLGGTHAAVWRALEGAGRVVVYGLSLHPLDAELCQTLAAGLDSGVEKEVLVITPDHKSVAHRINLLVNPARRIKVLGMTPDNLSLKVDHTPQRTYA